MVRGLGFSVSGLGFGLRILLGINLILGSLQEDHKGCGMSRAYKGIRN